MTKTINPFMRALVVICLALGLTLTAACTGSVSGKVYFDNNGNGELDVDEGGVPYAKLTVTRDGETVAQHYADRDGIFDIPIKQRAGYVCVDTDLSFTEANLDLALQSVGKDAAAQKLRVSPKALNVPSSDDEDEAEDEEAEDDDADDEDDGVTVDTEAKPALPDGWSGAKYCQNVKFKGFEVDVPVVFDVSAARAEIPSRLPVKCYAGERCELRIPYPLGCVLDPLELTEGLKLVIEDQPDVASYDTTFNVVTFSDKAAVEPAAQKAQSASATLSISGYEMAILMLETSPDIELGTTDATIAPSAECYGDNTELDPIPIELTRDLSAAVYQHLRTPIGSDGYMTGGQDVTVSVIVENRGRSVIENGEVTFTPPAGSVVQNAAGCFNYGTKLLCKIDRIGAGQTYTQLLTFKLPEAQADDTTVSASASFFAEGMPDAIQADQVSVLIEGTGST